MKFSSRKYLLAAGATVAGTIVLATPAARADLLIKIFDNNSPGTPLTVVVSGVLNSLPAPDSSISPNGCGSQGFLSDIALCTGPDNPTILNLYSITGGPLAFPLTGVLSPASSYAGSAFSLNTGDPFNFPLDNTVGIDVAYMVGTPFYSRATFAGDTLSSIGLALGPIGTWSLSGTSETITMVATVVPGPLPAAGAAAAFAVSRRLRKRIRLSQAV